MFGHHLGNRVGLCGQQLVELLGISGYITLTESTQHVVHPGQGPLLLLSLHLNRVPQVFRGRGYGHKQFSARIANQGVVAAVFFRVS